MNNPFQQFEVVTKSKTSQEKPAIKVLSTKGRFQLSQEVYTQLGNPKKVEIHTNYSDLKKAVDEKPKLVKGIIKDNSELKDADDNKLLEYMMKEYFIAKIVKSDDGNKVGDNLQFSNAAAWELIGGAINKTISFSGKVNNDELIITYADSVENDIRRKGQ